jgi:hypothetical protein
MAGRGPVLHRCCDVGLTGLEPVTLRLSSACSNQLSYRPGSNRKVFLTFSLPPAAGLTAVRSTGDKGIRTPDL